MKFLVFILVVVCIAGILFWNDIFDGETDPAERGMGPIHVVDSESEAPGPGPKGEEAKAYSNLMKEERWDEALTALDKLPGSNENIQLLVARHYCLIELGRTKEAGEVMDILLKKEPSSPMAVRSVIHSLENGSLPPVEIRKQLSRVSENLGALDPNGVAKLVTVVKKINAALPASIEDLVKTEDYKVKPNDSLWKICKNYNRDNNLNVEVGLIKMLNRLKKDIIHPGDIMAIPKEKVSIKIWRQNWLLTVNVGKTLLCAYRIGLGSDDSTPVGDFIIKKRLKNPAWYSENLGGLIPYGDEENVLGTRWLGFENQPNARGLGIHGTMDNGSIGKNLSSGCIRLTNEDVEALFEIIARDTPVKIM
jgi:lipoprotein-anchoring transpeptidase ErfK/SrfK